MLEPLKISVRLSPATLLVSPSSQFNSIPHLPSPWCAITAQPQTTSHSAFLIPKLLHPNLEVFIITPATFGCKLLQCMLNKVPSSAKSRDGILKFPIKVRSSPQLHLDILFMKITELRIRSSFGGIQPRTWPQFTLLCQLVCRYVPRTPRGTVSENCHAKILILMWCNQQNICQHKGFF